MLVCLLFYSVFLSFSTSPDSFLSPLDNFNNWKTKLLSRTACRRQTVISRSHCQAAEWLQHLWPASWPRSRSVPQAIQLLLGAGEALARGASQWSCRSVTQGAESTGRCLMTLEAVQDIRKGIRMLGEDCKMSPYEKQGFAALLTNCSFPEGSKTQLFPNKRIKLFFKNLKRVLKFHHFSRSSVLIRCERIESPGHKFTKSTFLDLKNPYRRSGKKLT